MAVQAGEGDVSPGHEGRERTKRDGQYVHIRRLHKRVDDIFHLTTLVQVALQFCRGSSSPKLYTHPSRRICTANPDC